MIYKFIFLSLSLISLSTIAMQDQQLTRIVKIRIQAEEKDFSVTHFSTVLDVKDALRESEGISVEQQSLCPLMPGSCEISWIGNRLGPSLENNENIVALIAQYRTSSFVLGLALRAPQS